MGCNSMNLFLDTNIIIYFLKGDQKVVELISRASKLSISFITEIELFCYDVSDPEMKSIKELLNMVEIYYPDSDNVKSVIKVRNNTGLKIPDAIIVAQAMQGDFILATFDKGLLRKIKNLNTIKTLNTL